MDKSGVASRIREWVNSESSRQIDSIADPEKEMDLTMLESWTADQIESVTEDLDEASKIRVGGLRQRANAARTLDEMDKRYRGKVISRQKKVSFENVSEDDNNSHDDGELSEEVSENDNDDSSSDSSSFEEEQEDHEDFEEEMPSESNSLLKVGPDPLLMQQLADIENTNSEEKQDDGFSVVRKASTKTSDIEKGQHILNQKRIWDSSMDLRIRTQKLLTMSNRFPLKTISLPEETTNALNEKLGRLTVSLTQIRQALGDFSPNSSDIFQQHSISKDLHLGVLNKWSMKTQLSQGKLKDVKTSGLKSFNQSLSSQVNAALGDMDRLVKRTRMQRTVYSIIGEKRKDIDGSSLSDDNLCPEIFDDNDFFHKLLKDLVTSGSDLVTDSIVVETEQLADSVLKKKKRKLVDTRASKDRKIRYTVHPKLVNFMAPEPAPILSGAAEISLEVVDGLFSALLK